METMETKPKKEVVKIWLSNWILFAATDAANRFPRRAYSLKIGENNIGRSSKSDIPIPSYRCSRKHCKIYVEKDQVIVSDDVS